MTNKLLLMLGPPGAGKTTVIRELGDLDHRFTYISPYITRPLRVGESDKVSVSRSRLNELWQSGELLVVNELYGIKYGTPRRPIERAFEGNMFPVLDWPIARLDVMERAWPGRLHRVYLVPPSVEALEQRLRERAGSDLDDRLSVAKQELRALARKEYDHLIDLRLVTDDGNTSIVAQRTYESYLGDPVSENGKG